MTPEIRALLADLEGAGYIAEPATATAVFLARATQKPLLIEGDAGVGKTELAKVLARLLGTELIRLQCYEGLDAQTALYEWDYPRQMLRLRMSQETARENPRELEAQIFSREYLLERPLLRAITRPDRSPVLLIDEIDRADDGFEAFLLELLSDFQVTIPELGTIRAEHPPTVVLTSNRTRELGDALRRRCLYLYLDHPSLEREVRIIRSRCPDAKDPLPDQIARFLQALRARAGQTSGCGRDPGFHACAPCLAAGPGSGRGHANAGLSAEGQTRLRHGHAVGGGVAGGLARAGAPAVTFAADAPLAIARFGGALRAHGIATSVRDEIDAAGALPFIDTHDREEVRTALRIALKVPRPGWETFDRLFAGFWNGEGRVPEPPPRRPPVENPKRRPGRPLGWDPVARRMVDAPEDGGEAPGGRSEGLRPAWTPAALLRRKSFDSAWSAQELAAMEKILARLARRLATRRSRRWVPTPVLARGRFDPRRSYRRALATEGEIVHLARRTRAIEEPRLVFLCDTSGSMDAHTRFLLSFVLSLRRAARKAELYAFNTELVHLTPALAPGKLQLALDRLAVLVPDWSGGTRIGGSLAAFAADHLRRVVDGKTVVVILSDGLDRGDPRVLVEALRQIRNRARKLVWLNPLLGDPDYQPTARGMLAALPFIDCFAPAFNLESLERLLPQLVV